MFPNNPFMNFGMPGMGLGMPMGGFQQQYRCYPVSFIDKPQVENGDKIILPPSALDLLARLSISYPMLFELTNPRFDRKTHCGVLEFIAEEGMAYLPYWMMQNLLLEEGNIITVKSATLRKGTFVKFQPQTSDFLEISNPKAVLETALRKFSVLTKGDTVRFPYNNRSYNLDVLETKPANAISLIETDLQVDFVPPLDYKEPVRPAPAAAAPAPSGLPVARSSPPASSSAPADAEDSDDEPAQPKFKAFVGSGYRLDGKPVNPSAAPSTAAVASSSARSAPQGIPGRTASVGSSGSNTPSASPAPGAGGSKLLFGHSTTNPAAPAQPAAKKTADSDDDSDGPAAPASNFKAFSGKGYSLK